MADRAAASSEQDLRRITLRGGGLEVTVLPELGAKILSIKDAADGHEYLWRALGRPLRRPVYGTRYVDWDWAGFDECFPTIVPCHYPEPPWDGVWLPDHGELWCTPWEAAPEGDGWRMWASGVRLPYLFERRIDLPAPGQVRLRYRLRNLCAYQFHYLWSAHPTFVVTARTRVLVPGGEAPGGLRFRVNHSRGHELGRLGDAVAWERARYAGGESARLGEIRPGSGHAAKLFSERLGAQQGWAALHETDTGRFAAVAFDPARMPHLGIWRDEAGSPHPPPEGAERGAPHLHVALEPCTGFPDRLDFGMARGESATVGPREEVTWELRLVFGRAPRIAGFAPDGGPLA